MFFGFNLAFFLQYRFAAAESVSVEHASRAISWVLLGSIGGALLTPEILNRTAGLFINPYLGGLLFQSVLYLVVAFSLLFLGKFNIHSTTNLVVEDPRSLKQLLLSLPKTNQ